MVPVAGSTDKPAGLDEKVPPGKPVMIGVCGVPEVQYVADVYTKDAISAAVMVTVVVAVTAAHPPLAGTVLVMV